MSQGIQAVPRPANESVRGYEANSPERAALQAEITRQSNQIVEIPIIVGGKEIRTGKLADVRCPHDHSHVLARYHEATPGDRRTGGRRRRRCLAHLVRTRLPGARQHLPANGRPVGRPPPLPDERRHHAGPVEDLPSGGNRSGLRVRGHAAVNAYFLDQLVRQQPVGEADPGVWNYLEYRALEGFIFAVSPFNFTALGGNLAMAPAIMGNTIVWKPAETQMLSAYYLMELYKEAGLPDGIVNMLPGHGPTIGARALAQETLAGVHFTGSTATFQHIWKTVGENIANYRSYPRIVGETGGKNFVVAHESADAEALVANLIRGAYEFQGQKCSAASRAYLPASMKDDFLARFQAEAATVTMGDPTEFSNFMGAVIDERSFNKISGYLDVAREDPSCTVMLGGNADRSKGWFVEPTMVVTDNPQNRLMNEEIFGPGTDRLLLPGQPVRRDPRPLPEHVPVRSDRRDLRERPVGRRAGIRGAASRRRQLLHQRQADRRRDRPAAFGGGRASGTNDKTGLGSHLLRWTNIRTVKENFAPAKDYRYPFLSA